MSTVVVQFRFAAEKDRKNEMDLNFLLFCRRLLATLYITQRAVRDANRRENGLLNPTTSLVPYHGVTSLMNSSVKELRIGSFA
jgi:hypothetical protein